MRLDRRVSEGWGLSRRVAGHAIRKGRVAVDGVVVRDPGAAVAGVARVELDGSAAAAAPPRVALLHKPVGVQSTVADPHGRPSLAGVAAELLDQGLHPVGRLDADTDGLLLFSADGALTQRLLHPRRAVVRLYVARVDPPPTDDLGDRLRAGIATADGTFSGDLRAVDGDRLTLAVTEGKHRMVRRMLANAGHPVLALRRIAFGPFTLGDLAPGAWRAATDAEIAAIDA